MKKKLSAAAVALGLATAMSAFNVMADANGGAAAADAAVGSLNANQGEVFCTAAVNSDGTLASSTAGSFVQSSGHVGLGQYEVFFKKPCNKITAAEGFARFVQVDTLTTGTTSGYCATADRATGANGVWINCFDGTGAAADRSFFLFVTR